MRRLGFWAPLLLLAVAGTAQAHGRVRVGVHLWWPWWGPWWWGPAEVVPVVQAKAPDLAVVDTDVSPEHALVYLDGQLIGTADDFDGNPDYLYLKPGHYTLEFALAGYESHRVEIDAQPGRYFPLDFKLARKPGEKPAPWYDRPEGLPVARVFGKGPEPSKTPKPRPDPSLRPELAPKPRPESPREGKAALRFAVEPANAAVYLDGEFVGTGEELAHMVRGLAVEPGVHRVEVLAPGYGAERREVTVEAGQELHVQVTLSGGAGQTQNEDL
ncbi:MAG: PEGA domain-containing protein [Thermoanaerobaculum sp.]